MPEGPSIVILKEEAAAFAGRKVLRVSGNSRLDLERLRNQKVVALRSWGKHFLIEFAHFSVRIHFMLFGSYRIDARKDTPARLSLGFSKGQELNFYACSVKFIDAPLDTVYDWSGDVMSPDWDPAQARRKLRAQPHTLAADALLDQTIFSGVGNIIKNEVLHRIRVHPESEVGALPPRKLAHLVEQARTYSFDFYAWKQAYVLKKHYQVHTRTVCPRDGQRLTYRKHLGKAARRAFYCERCQTRYPAASGDDTD
ncbi:endonuclease [Xanthomonas sp. Kuri4-1]